MPAYTNIIHDFSNLFLISRDEAGNRVVDQRPATFDCFTPKGERLSFPKHKLRKEYYQKNPDTREADVMPPRRFISDHSDVVIQKPRKIWLDIETDSRISFQNKHLMRVLCYALVDEQENTFTGMLDEDSDEGERRLLRQLWNHLLPYDLIAGWNIGSAWDTREYRNGEWLTLPGPGFDMPTLRARMRRLSADQRKLEREMQFWLILDSMQVFKRANTAAASGEERQSYRLDHVARMVLGEGKDDFDSSKCWEAWSGGGRERDRMLEYCAKDTLLVKRINDKRCYEDLYQSVCSLCNTFLDTHGIKPVELFDGVLLRMGAERGIRFPTKPAYQEDSKRERFSGAFVMDAPEPGIIHNVRVADFAALYSSIIRSWNISAETFDKPGAITPTSGRTYGTEAEGMLPMVLNQFAEMRKKSKALAASLPEGSPEWKEADRESTALKVIGNTGYGVASSKYSRFGSDKIGESITQTGVFLLKRTKALAEEMGLTVSYGDTDSLFLRGATEAAFKDFLRKCNEELLPSLAKHYGCIKNYLKIDSDKTLDFVVFSAKKRYAGRYSSGHPCIKGYEYLRGDGVKIAAKMQKALIDRFVSGDFEPENYHLTLTEVRNHILYDELPAEEVTLSESLSKDPAEYDTASPVVSVAKILQERGSSIEPGTKLAYIVTDGSVSPMQVIPAEDYRGECDRFWLWESAIMPASQRFLAAAFPHHDWERWLKVRPVVSPQGRKYEAREAKGQLRIPGLDS